MNLKQTEQFLRKVHYGDKVEFEYRTYGRLRFWKEIIKPVKGYVAELRPACIGVSKNYPLEGFPNNRRFCDGNLIDYTDIIDIPKILK